VLSGSRQSENRAIAAQRIAQVCSRQLLRAHAGSQRHGGGDDRERSAASSGIFERTTKHPCIRLTIRQRMRVLQRWPKEAQPK
jgi:hypothetical protein